MRKVGREGGDHFLSFLKIIATKQRQEDVSSEQYKVTINLFQNAKILGKK